MSQLQALSTNTLVFVGTLATVLMVALVVAVLLIRQRQMLARYDAEHHRAVISILRENYEDKIAELNSRLLATEERWKDVNHLLLDGQRKQPDHDVDPHVDARRFLRQFGIDATRPEVDPKLIFVLTPFSQREASTFRAVQNIAQRIGFRAVRGDEEFVRDEILPHVVQLIVQARIVVANISGPKPERILRTRHRARARQANDLSLENPRQHSVRSPREVRRPLRERQ